MRRAKLVGFVKDAFVRVYRPPSLVDCDDDDVDAALVAAYNRSVRTPFGRVIDGSGCELRAFPNKERVAIDGKLVDWTDCQLYLQFLSDVQLRIPGMPLEIHDTNRPPLRVSIGSSHIEAWLQMTVSVSCRIR